MEPSIGILATRTAKWAVREGDWKLIGNVQDSSGGKLNSEDQKLFLANLSEDPTERINLANRNPEIVLKLLKAHEDWFATASNPAGK